MPKGFDIRRFEKKPISILAVQLTPDNIKDVQAWILHYRGSADISDSGIYIKTLEGAMKGQFGDMIIQGTAGEFYPCKKEIFENLHVIPEDFEFDM